METDPNVIEMQVRAKGDAKIHEVPTVEDVHERLPGEVVMKFRKDNNSWGTAFTVRKVVLENGSTQFESAVPYRSCVYAGHTIEESLANLIRGVSILSREGAFDPEDPHKEGSPPIQHAIHVLTQQLLRRVEHRRDALSRWGWYPGCGTSSAEDPMVKQVGHHNEVISALSTAIAALARVKEL